MGVASSPSCARAPVHQAHERARASRRRRSASVIGGVVRRVDQQRRAAGRRPSCRSPGSSPIFDSAGSATVVGGVEGRRGRLRSSVSSAVISFAVDPIGRRRRRRARRRRRRSTASSRIALGAVTSGERRGAAAAPASSERERRRRARPRGRAPASLAKLDLVAGVSVCGSRSGLSARICASGTPVFSAMPDGVSPGLDRVASCARLRDFCLPSGRRRRGRARARLAAPSPARARAVDDDEEGDAKTPAQAARESARGCDRPSGAMIAPAGRLRRAPRPARAGARPRRGPPSAGSPPGCSCARRSSARRSRAPPARPGAKAGASVATSPPWAPMPGSRNGVRGISSRMRARCSGAVAPVTAPTRRGRTAPGAPARRRAREALPQRPAVGELAGRTGRARRGWRCARARTRRRRPRVRRAIERLERVAAQQRVGGQRVGAEARRRRRTATASRRTTPGRRRRRCRHVAALAVGEHEQAGARAHARRRLEREPAGEAEPLEAGELRLDRDAGGAGGVDQREAVGEHRGRGLERRRARRSGRRGAALTRRAPWRGARAATPVPRARRATAGRVGVDPEDDLGLARRDRGREAVAERPRRRWATLPPAADTGAPVAARYLRPS